MDTDRVHLHVHDHDHDHDTVEAHYASLERLRPHACMGGRVFVGYIDEYGEEQYEAYVCRRCQEQQSEEETS